MRSRCLLDSLVSLKYNLCMTFAVCVWFLPVQNESLSGTSDSIKVVLKAFGR